MTMHTLVRMMRRQEYKDAAHFVEEINKGLCEQSIVSEKGGFITLLTAFKTLLHRYSRQDDITVGVPISSRTRILKGMP